MANLTVDLERVRLSGRDVLHQVRFTAAPGEFIGLLGPNGAGKTTLIRAVLELIPAEGSAALGSATGRALRALTGYVPQRHEVAWDFPITVAECVLAGRADLRGWWRPTTAADRAARDEALGLADIEAVSERPIGELSGGQRQRVLVARALARKPQLLVLDEPFTGVDTPTTEGLLKLFCRLADSGTTVLMSSHNLGETVDAADRVLLLNRTLIGGDITTPEPWIEAFQVSADSPLLRTVGVA